MVQNLNKNVIGLISQSIMLLISQILCISNNQIIQNYKEITFPVEMKIATSESWENICNLFLQIIKTGRHVCGNREAPNFGLLIASSHQKGFHRQRHLRIVLFKNKTLTAGMRFSKLFFSVPTTNLTTSMRPRIITNGSTTSFIWNVKFTISWSCDSVQPKQFRQSCLFLDRRESSFAYQHDYCNFWESRFRYRFYKKFKT